MLNIPGVEVRPDGDVVRIELPAARLFQSGGAALQPAGGTLIDTVAIEIARNYPEQTIGIEAHTSNEFVRTSQGFDNQQLSVAQATAVYQYLVQRGQIPASRMFIAGHGSNHPVVSNATAAGKARNAARRTGGLSRKGCQSVTGCPHVRRYNGGRIEPFRAARCPSLRPR